MTQYPEAWLCRELGMAVVNISLITDYDAGVLEGTEAVNAMSVLEVFQQNAERIQARRASTSSGASRPTSTRSGRAPRSSRRAATATRSRARTSGCSRRACDRFRARSGRRRGPGSRLPIGVSLRTIRAEPGWWLESARRLDAAGYAGVWAWDHFMGRGDLTVPVVESWTIAVDGRRADRTGDRRRRSCSTS